MKLENIFEGGIYNMDPENPSDPEVLVDGVGRYRLSQLKENVRRKLKDIGNMANVEDTPENWKKINWMLNHAAMHEMVKTIIQANDELQKEIH